MPRDPDCQRRVDGPRGVHVVSRDGRTRARSTNARVRELPYESGIDRERPRRLRVVPQDRIALAASRADRMRDMPLRAGELGAEWPPGMRELSRSASRHASDVGDVRELPRNASRARPRPRRLRQLPPCTRARRDREATGVRIMPPRHKRPGLHRVSGHDTCASCHLGHEAAARDDRATCLGCHWDQTKHEPTATRCTGCHPFGEGR